MIAISGLETLNEILVGAMDFVNLYRTLMFYMRVYSSQMDEGKRGKFYIHEE